MEVKDLMIGFNYIPQYEGLYSIDRIGNVFSHISGKILKPHSNHRGYLMVDLYKDGKVKKGIIHKLVAITYIPNPNNLPEIDHIDTNRQNNNVENLRWCTRKENCNNSITKERISKALLGSKRTEEQKQRMKEAQQKAKPMLGKRHSKETLEKFKQRKPPMLGKFGSENPNSMPVAIINDNGQIVECFASSLLAHQKYGIARESICRCRNGKQKTSGGYKWAYIHKIYIDKEIEL